MLALVADVGGSNTRLALARRHDDGVVLEHVVTHPTPTGTLVDCLHDYWIDVGQPGVAAVAVGAAGRVHHHRDGYAQVHLTNKALTLDSRALAAACAAPHGILLGDLAACAHALPLLGRPELTPIGAELPAVDDTRLVIGVGTGFGAAIRSREGRVLATEAGHMDLAAVGAQERRWSEHQSPGLRPSVEDLLSGNGLLRLAQTVSGQRYASCDALFAQARAGDAAACTVITAFSSWLGRTASNLVLATGAWGGVYLVGGVIRGLGAQLDTSAFRAGFEDKSPFGTDLAAVPVFRIDAAEPALLGLGGHALDVTGLNAPRRG